MSLVSQQLPNLVGGISQQPDSFRRPNQCESAVNTYNDPVSGVKKRAGSYFLSEVTGSTSEYWFDIQRDNEEKYLINVDDSGIRVFDRSGTERVVNAPSGYSYLSNGEYKAISIADTTFIVNTKVTVAEDASLTTDYPDTAMVFVRAVDFEVTYTLDSPEPGFSPITFTTSSSAPISVSQVSEDFNTKLNLLTGYSSVVSGGVIRFTGPAASTITATTSQGEDFIVAIPSTVQNFGDLPKEGLDQIIVKVSGDPSTDVDDYYVVYNGNNWVETVAGGISTGFDISTMPHGLTRLANGEFEFKPFEWGERLSGDEDSNPVPSFVGQKINNILFERNRLGFLSDVNCILSEADGINNFFRSTVTTIVDSDPIDLSGNGRSVDILYSSIPVKDGVLLFSESGQFLMNAGEADILSPSTARITSISNYQTSTDVDPIRVGDSILFMTKRDSKSGVREYFYQSNRDFTQSASITNHIPFLLPEKFYSITGSSTENIVFFIPSSGETLYTYQYLYSGEDKVISAWCEWDFNQSPVRYAAVFEDYLHIVVDRGAFTAIERIPLTNSFIQSPLVSEVCLDSAELSSSASSSTFDGTDTTFTFDRPMNLDNLVCIALNNEDTNEIVRGDVLDITASSALSQTDIVFEGDYTSVQFMIGESYDFTYQFSIPFVRLQEGDVDIDSRLQIRNYTIQIADTGNCLFEVQYPNSRTNSDIRFISDVDDWSSVIDMSTLETDKDDSIQSYTYPLSRAFPNLSLDTSYNLVSHEYRVPINCRNTGFNLIVRSDSWQPVRLSKASWEGMYYKRSRFI